MGRDTLIVILEALEYLLEDKYSDSYGWEARLYELKSNVKKELDKEVKL